MSARTDPQPQDADRKLPPEEARWLKKLAGLARRPMAWALAAPLLAGALLLGQTWLLARVLHQAIAIQVPVTMLWPSLAGMALLVLARAALARLGEHMGAVAAEQIKRAVREALVARLLAAGPQWSRARASGALASVVVEQADAFEGFFARYLPAVVAGAVLPLAFAIALFPVDWIVALLLLLTVPVIPMFMALVGWGAEAASRRHAQAFARLSGFFADRLRGLSTLKLYGRAHDETQAVRHASDDLRERTMGVLRIAFLSSAVLELFAAVGVAGVALYVGLSYLGFLDLRVTPLTLQMGLFCLLMAPEVYLPLRQMAVHYHDRASARAAVGEISAAFEGLPAVADTLALAPRAQVSGPRTVVQEGGGGLSQGTGSPRATGRPLAGNPVAGNRVAGSPAPGTSAAGDALDGSVLTETPGTEALGFQPYAAPSDDHPDLTVSASPRPTAAGPITRPPAVTVEVRNLVMRVPDDGRVLLRAPTLVLAPGEHAALTGASGSGKTSLIEALCGLRDHEGQIWLDGVPVAKLPEPVLRQRVACLGQRPHLFHGSIADNIRLARPSASDADVARAAALACVTEFAVGLPDGLSTQIGARGYGLSGGEAHRVALARLFLRDPGWIVLDEPTAHLDGLTELRVLDAILDFARGRTLLLATHSGVVAGRLGRVLHIDQRGHLLTGDDPAAVVSSESV